jgi:hypothetical protein
VIVAPEGQAADGEFVCAPTITTIRRWLEGKKGMSGGTLDLLAHLGTYALVLLSPLKNPDRGLLLCLPQQIPH